MTTETQMTADTYSWQGSTEMHQLRDRVEQKLIELRRTRDTLKDLQARLQPPYISHDELRRKLNEENLDGLKKIDLSGFNCGRNWVYDRPDPVYKRLIGDILKSRRYDGIEGKLTPTTNAMYEIEQRTMTEKQYTGLLKSYNQKPEKPSNPVEDRPTIIYPDARQYKADMRKLAKGLEKRLGAVKAGE